MGRIWLVSFSELVASWYALPHRLVPRVSLLFSAPERRMPYQTMG